MILIIPYSEESVNFKIAKVEVVLKGLGFRIFSGIILDGIILNGIGAQGVNLGSVRNRWQ
ncbi:MAG: hypothetical protein COA99_17490 [Moraxellaceae bacterium]|nr:MAG: hypothetical protein COA99_17490 [Moraxellaceae bacterium]